MAINSTKIKIFGHRGAMGYAPENTLASIRVALQLGVDGVEFDVLRARSGELVLMHDATVNRTTDGFGWVKDYTLKEIKKLDAGGGEKVPSLHEALDVINQQAVANIELKGPGTAEPVASTIRGYLQRGWQPEKFFVSSYNHKELKKFHELMPQVEVAALFYLLPPNYLGVTNNFDYISPLRRLFRKKDIIKKAHENQRLFLIGNLNTATAVREHATAGVDIIFSNYPDIARKALSGIK